MELVYTGLLLIWIVNNTQVSYFNYFLTTCGPLTNYLGLGQYLSEIDPQHRDPVWQLEHIIIFCRVHFQRSILKAIGTRHRGSPLWSLMMDLLNCSSEAEYDELLRLLIGNKQL